ncbi:MAG: glycosyltransferase family 2 protein [Clostridia bacterium]|nr:glycosyltransferase family 2 protein [Clostridia bacterium]
MIEPKILVIIPAYNEEESIDNVIRKIKYYSNVDIVVVNDGSKDGTAKKALKEGVRVITLPFNLGIGGAMQTGYIFARDNHYDIAIQIDGDGQHDPLYLDKLIEPLKQDRCDMAIGSRYVEETAYRSSVTRRMGMIFFSWLIYALTGWKIKDTTSGFRAVNRKIIEYYAGSYPTDYPEVDVLVRLHKKRFRVMEVPVEMLERQGGSSSITPLKSIYYMVKVSTSLVISSLRSGGMS